MLSFCDSCGRSSHPVFVTGEREVDIRGEKVVVSYKKPVCPYCCEEIYREETESYISEQAIKIYKNRMRMVPAETLASFLKKQDPDEVAKKLACATNELIGGSHGALMSRNTDKKLKRIMKELA